MNTEDVIHLSPFIMRGIPLSSRWLTPWLDVPSGWSATLEADESVFVVHPFAVTATSGVRRAVVDLLGMLTARNPGGLHLPS